MKIKVLREYMAHLQALGPFLNTTKLARETGYPQSTIWRHCNGGQDKKIDIQFMIKLEELGIFSKVIITEVANEHQSRILRRH